MCLQLLFCLLWYEPVCRGHRGHASLCGGLTVLNVHSWQFIFVAQINYLLLFSPLMSIYSPRLLGLNMLCRVFSAQLDVPCSQRLSSQKDKTKKQNKTKQNGGDSSKVTTAGSLLLRCLIECIEFKYLCHAAVALDLGATEEEWGCGRDWRMASFRGEMGWQT